MTLWVLFFSPICNLQSVERSLMSMYTANLLLFKIFRASTSKTPVPAAVPAAVPPVTPVSGRPQPEFRRTRSIREEEGRRGSIGLQMDHQPSTSSRPKKEKRLHRCCLPPFGPFDGMLISASTGGREGPLEAQISLLFLDHLCHFLGLFSIRLWWTAGTFDLINFFSLPPMGTYLAFSHYSSDLLWKPRTFEVDSVGLFFKNTTVITLSSFRIILTKIDITQVKH